MTKVHPELLQRRRQTVRRVWLGIYFGALCGGGLAAQGLFVACWRDTPACVSLVGDWLQNNPLLVGWMEAFVARAGLWGLLTPAILAAAVLGGWVTWRVQTRPRNLVLEFPIWVAAAAWLAAEGAMAWLIALVTSMYFAWYVVNRPAPPPVPRRELHPRWNGESK